MERLYGTYDKYLIAAITNYPKIKATADAYDAALITDMSILAGEEYTTFLALIQRHHWIKCVRNIITLFR